MNLGLRIALVWIRLVATLIPHAQLRTRYREEWESDLRGASDIGLHPLTLGAGLTAATVRVAFAARKGHVMVPIGPLALRCI